MPKLTALIHTHRADDAPRLARALESLRPCDEVLVINHGHSAEVEEVCREHGASLKPGIPGVSPGAHISDASNDWVFCLLVNESLSEALEAALFEWKNGDPEPSQSFSAAIREESGTGWRSLLPETRLVNCKNINWTGELPANTAGSRLLAGELLRISNP